MHTIERMRCFMITSAKSPLVKQRLNFSKVGVVPVFRATTFIGSQEQREWFEAYSAKLLGAPVLVQLL